MDNNRTNVFMIMPFREEILALFDELKRRFEEKCVFCHAGDLDNQRNILKNIVDGIDQADIVIADLTGLNPNVFYELGLAHAMNKKVIILVQGIDELPFDIRSYRAVDYSLLFHKVPALIAELDRMLSGAIEGSVKFGNPVSDFLPDFFLRQSNTTPIASPEQPASTEHSVNEEPVNVKDDEIDGKGFLAFITDINENSEAMTTELNSMCDEMADMNRAVNNATNEINRVKSQSGNVDPAFARNICRKLAPPVETFSIQLQGRVANIDQFWRKVENSYLALLDNPFTRKPENTDGLRGSLDSMETLQTAIFDSDDKIRGFSTALQGSMGMERRLNKAIASLISELDAYLTTTSTMSSSIDRIISKGNITIDAISQERK